MTGAQRLTIEVIDEQGKPIEPLNHARTFVNQCGVIVRDTIPITIQEWNRPKNAPEGFTSYVTDESKDDLWTKLLEYFILPEECDEFEADGTTPNPDGRARRKKVRDWALSKMSEQFRNHKKNLWAEYQANLKKDPGFVLQFKGKYEKCKAQWPAFVQYKQSPQAIARSKINRDNAKAKKYHHRLGTGGYVSAVPKWEAMEDAFRAKGITPGTDGWPERAKHWWYAHGGTLHPETGETVFNEKILHPSQKLIDAMADAQRGIFKPERENDELTRALGNPEHPGRTRGKGAGVPWKKGVVVIRSGYTHDRARFRQARVAHRGGTDL